MSRRLFFGVSEQAKAARHRLDDAKVLLAAGRWRGAMYLAGYSVECLLKTKLMRQLGCRNLQQLDDGLTRRGAIEASATVFTHQLELLLRLLNADERLRQHREHWRNFTIVNGWVPAWRYAADPANPKDAPVFLEAVVTLSAWIENNT